MSNFINDSKENLGDIINSLGHRPISAINEVYEGTAASESGSTDEDVGLSTALMEELEQVSAGRTLDA